VPHAAVRAMFPTGTWSAGFLERYLPSGPLHASASLGIAEAAQEQATAFVSSRPAQAGGRRAAERPRLQVLAAENAVDLAAARATLARAGTLIDGYYATHWAAPAPVAELHEVFKEVQCAKTFVHGAAIRTVDRALTMSGGAGYMNRNRLSRHYRDVRAGPFMHPLGDNIVHEYIGQVTLGVEPSLA
jgi:alkylation response protein AidB-like acyl-CoA dehydrogenase